MFFFKKNKSKQNIEEIIKKINHKDLIERYFYLVIGCFIAAFTFNLFFLKYKIVCFGISGISVILNEYGINPSAFILISSILLLIYSYFVLGKEKTKSSAIGSILLPIFIYVTEFITRNIYFENVEKMLIAIFGAVLSGIGYGIIFKSGFTTGGTDIIDQVIAKYFKTSMGKSMIYVDGLIVLSGLFTFNVETFMYGIIILYVVSIMTDKVILGISNSKAFYIVTEKKEETLEFLLSLESIGVTVIESHGGYTHNKNNLLLCVIPTKKYFIVKEGLKQIDKDIFFVVTDSYEVNRRGLDEFI